MPDRETLFQLLLIVAASLALLSVAFVFWLRRNAAADAGAALGSQTSATAAAAAASPSGTTSASTYGAPDVRPSHMPRSGADESTELGASWATTPVATTTETGASLRTTSTEDVQPDRDGLIDPATGLKTSLAWEEALRHEEARHGRYGRAATVVVGELVGLDTLAERLGQEAADRLIAPVAATLQRGTRASDIVARIGHARFYILLPETDEINAINYVDRVREATDLWLSAGAVAVRLALGWASPQAGGTLTDAVRAAEERMNADRHVGPSPRAFRRAASTPRDASA